eukprot:g57419.t1
MSTTLVKRLPPWRCEVTGCDSVNIFTQSKCRACNALCPLFMAQPDRRNWAVSDVLAIHGAFKNSVDLLDLAEQGIGGTLRMTGVLSAVSVVPSAILVAMSDIDTGVIIEEFRGIDVDLDAEDDSELLQACAELCQKVEIEPHELATKWDAFAYANQKERNALNLASLKMLERSIREALKREQNQRKQEKKVTHTAGPNVLLDKIGLGSLTSALGASFSRTFGVTVEEPVPTSELSPEKGALKKEQNDVDLTPPSKRVKTEHASSSSQHYGSPGMAYGTDSPSMPILASPSQSVYANRQSRGKILTTLNPTLKAAEAPDTGSDTGLTGAYVGGRLQCEDLSAPLWSEFRADGSVVPFRYMMEDEEEVCEQLNQHSDQVLETMLTSATFRERCRASSQPEEAQKEAVPGQAGATTPGLVKEEPSDDKIDLEAIVTSSYSYSSSSSSSSSSSAPASSKALSLAGDADGAEDAADLQAVNLPSQESRWFGGRIRSDDDDVLKAASVELEGSRAHSQGARVKLRLGFLESYALFPGQVVLGRGVNSHGTQFVVEEFLPPVFAPHLGVPSGQVSKINQRLKERPFTIVSAAGPFTCSDSLSHSPLFDLLVHVNKLQPDLLLLMGPFVDAQHPELQKEFTAVSFQDMFADLIKQISRHTRFLSGTKIVLVPSTRDLHHHNVFPQPPFELPRNLDEDERKKFLVVPNPCVLRVNDFSLALCSEDLCFHYQRNQLYKKAQAQPGTSVEKDGKSNAGERILTDIIAQQSFLSLRAPKPLSGLNVDFSLMERYRMPCTPDLFITQSRFMHFATVIGDGVVAVNAKSLSQDKSGGSYASITIHPLSDEQMASERLSSSDGGLKKEGSTTNSNRKQVYEHFLSARTRVDIVRI